jgi:hypothetical protein
LKHWDGINLVILAKKINFLKHWVGINPVILAQKNQFFETLGWYQPSDFSQKNQFFETLGRNLSKALTYFTKNEMSFNSLTAILMYYSKISL